MKVCMIKCLRVKWMQYEFLANQAAADAKFYGHMEVYSILKARGAKVPKTKRTAMVVENPKEVPEFELNLLEFQVCRTDGIVKGMYQLAKWNGTKVAAKILEKESNSDP